MNEKIKEFELKLAQWEEHASYYGWDADSAENIRDMLIEAIALLKGQ